VRVPYAQGHRGQEGLLVVQLVLPIYNRILGLWCKVAGHRYPLSRIIVAGDYLVATCRCGDRVWNDTRDYPVGSAMPLNERTGVVS
jgi:hypothetical protein